MTVILSHRACNQYKASIRSEAMFPPSQLPHSPAMSDLGYVYCDSATRLSRLNKQLRQCKILCLDCEGVELGKQDGTITIVTICPNPTEASPTIYIVDLLNIPHISLRPIIEALNNPEIVKVMFDGRRDHLALSKYLHANISSNVNDLQIAIIMRRIHILKEGEIEQFAHLRGFLYEGQLEGWKPFLKNVHRLPSLQSGIAETNVPFKYQKGTGTMSSLLYIFIKMF